MHVEAIASAGMQNPQPHEVYQQPAQRHGHHQRSRPPPGFKESPIGFDENENRDRHQRCSIDQGSQDFRAVKAIRPLRRRRSLGNPNGEHAQPQGGRIGEHVAGVRQQGQRVGGQPADDLSHHVSASQHKDQREPLPVVGTTDSVVVVVHLAKRHQFTFVPFVIAPSSIS